MTTIGKHAYIVSSPLNPTFRLEILVRTSTRNLGFEQKYQNYQNLSSEIPNTFELACFRNGKETVEQSSLKYFEKKLTACFKFLVHGFRFVIFSMYGVYMKR